MVLSLFSFQDIQVLLSHKLLYYVNIATKLYVQLEVQDKMLYVLIVTKIGDKNGSN